MTAPQLVAVATAQPVGWMDSPQKGPPLPMLVKVLTDTNRRYEYRGLFRHTFDAYDDAMERYPHVQRIEVQAINSTTTTTTATTTTATATATATATGGAHGPQSST